VSKRIRVGVALVALTGALAVTASAGGANECDGLMVCVSVPGPWVVVPTSSETPRPEVQYHLSCPRGYIVGGLDAELSVRAIDVNFLAKLGSPVNPGISTERAAIFVASYVGAAARGPTFRPYLGCIPAAGGGIRIPTAATVFRPGRPTIRRVRNVRVRSGSATVSQGCRGRERLVGAAHAFAFHTRRPPSASLVSGVSGERTIRDGRVVVSVRGDAELGGVRAVVQVQAICVRTR
jgi:hypothetical protein